MVYNVRDCTFLGVASLIDGIFGEVRLDDVKFAEMSSASTFLADAILRIMMIKVDTRQLGGRLSKSVFFYIAKIVIMTVSLG